MTSRRAGRLAAVLAGLAAAAIAVPPVVQAAVDHREHRPTAGAARAQAAANSAATRGSTATALASRGRVIVVMEENHEAGRILGSPAAPFINRLARSGTVLASYYGIRHPSLPNYLAVLGGDTFGITSDCTRCSVRARNLVDQLEARHISWRGYFQSLPAACSNAAHSGAYAKKHNPFMYFRDIRERPARCRNVVPFTRFAADLRAGRLPRFVFVAPDLQHDMHDGTIATADRWVRDLHGRLAASSAWTPGTRFVLTFDEGTTDRGCCHGQAAGGRVATIVQGPGLRGGRTDRTPYDHYSLLASIEQHFGLSRLGYAASPASRVIPALR